MIKKLFSSYYFWIIFASLSCAAIFATWYFFPRAFPIVEVKITMDRDQALAQAQKIAQQLHLGPENYNQALQFNTDSVTKTFIELDAGGVPAFTSMIEQNLYQPYTWQVRHFKEFNAHELIVRFTPQGELYGFVETLAENEPGTNVTAEDAQQIGEKEAQSNWRVDLSNFHQIEASQETRHGGRIDHTFIYKRTNGRIGSGEYRLRLVVSGNKLTEVTYSVKVPEQFILRYKEMRSSNESLASAATMLMLVLYIIGGCIIGLLFLIRDRWILWKMPIIWGFIIAFLNLLAGFNELPLLWMSYDTALPAQGFLLNYIIELLFQFFAHAGSMALFFMAAESLTRRAFGNQLQFFKTWSTDVASTFSVLGQTVAGYLLVSFDFIFLVFFYLFTRTAFGWWVPADEIVNPNILATYFPWISSIAQSLMAGFQEECLFRAVPIASAALIGQRFGRRNLFISIAFVLQAFIFGAAHANYAAQPCYARLFELLVPSWIFGALYLAFGLLPGIILHFIIDVVWFALPIFVSCGLHAHINQAFVIVASLTPVWVILYSRLRTGEFRKASAAEYNAAWEPDAQKTNFFAKPTFETKSLTLSSKSIKIFVGIAALSLAAFIFFTPCKQDAPSLTISRSAAIQLAQEQLQNSIDIATFTPLANLEAALDLSPDDYAQHRYIWQSHNPDLGEKRMLYQHFINNYYLTPPHWLIRLVKFNGSLTDRTEEYQFKIADNGTIIQQAHKIAESVTLSSVHKERARQLALSEIQKQFKIPESQLEEISATRTHQPKRTDWSFTFNYIPSEKMARIVVEITGNQISTIYRTVHIDEAWKRNERHHFNTIKIISMINTFLLFMVLMLAAFLLLRSMHRIDIRLSVSISLILFLLFVANIANSYQEIIAHFNTIEPFSHQLFTKLSMISIFALVKAVFLGFIIVATLQSRSLFKITSTTQSCLLSISAGLAISGIIAVLNYFEPSLKPNWADFSPLAGSVPLFALLSAMLGKFITISIIALLLAALFDYVSGRYQQPILSASLVIICGLIMFPIDSILFWIVGGPIVGLALWCIYCLFLHKDRSLIPLVCGVYLSADLIEQAYFHVFPGVIIGSTIAGIIILVLAYLWFLGVRRG